MSFISENFGDAVDYSDLERDKWEEEKWNYQQERLFDDREAENEETHICGYCSGSGEGMYDGSRCHVCKGSGEV